MSVNAAFNLGLIVGGLAVILGWWAAGRGR